MLILLPAVFITANPAAHAGAGTSVLAVFEPATSATVKRNDAGRFGESLVAAVWKRMNDYEVWGIELLTHESVTSSALEHLGTRAPQWNEVYSPGWIDLLNSNEMISYGALGTWEAVDEDNRTHIMKYELWDFVTNYRIAAFDVTGTDTLQLADRLAERVVGELQLYFAEVVEIAGTDVVLSVGPEALSTGTRLLAYAHGHLGKHPPGYPPHGHREEDDHFIGSAVYRRYRGTVPGTEVMHAHSRTPFRMLMFRYPEAFEPMTTFTEGLLQNAGTTDSMSTIDPETSLTLQEKLLMEKVHFYSGRETGELVIDRFVKPRTSFNQYFAVGRVVDGFVAPGSFVKRKTRSTGD